MKTAENLCLGFGCWGERAFLQRSQLSRVGDAYLYLLTFIYIFNIYLQGMVQRRSGKILNVSSTASFLPGPLQAVYYASKAYVTSFSQAIAEEVREFGIIVTVLCPGAVATGFVQAGDLQDVDAWKNAKSAQSIAEYG